MRIEIEKIVINNFKGLKHFVFAPNGKNCKVFSNNGLGKTTIFDAENWCLFSKDSLNRADFDIKPLDENNQPIRGLSPEVEATLLVDGSPLVLRKVYSEKWVKQRGHAESTFSGHETSYYLDGVPVKKGEYQKRIDSLVSESIFKLLTNPLYFNTQLSWQERRKILLEVCGDLSDEQVILSKPELYELLDILGNRSIEDHRKVIASKRAEINKELDKIPVRVDEAERSKPNLEGLNEKQINDKITVLQELIHGQETKLVTLQSGGQIAVEEKHLREIEGQLLQIKNEVQKNSLEVLTAKRVKVSELSGEINKLASEIDRRQGFIAMHESMITDAKERATNFRKEWHAVHDEPFVHEDAENCPACGQTLPENQIAEAHEKALAQFNQLKSEQLERITAHGKAAMAEATRLNVKCESFEIEIVSLESQLAEKRAQLETAERDLKALESTVNEYESDPRYVEKLAEQKKALAKISTLRSSAQADIEVLRLALVDSRTELRELERQKAAFSQVQKADERVAELKQQERKLAAEFEQLEKELYLTEEFIRAKVSMLEERINSKFKYARFKLFETQVNGGIQEVCQVMYQGVPYNSMNHAATYLVGLDVLETLSEHYNAYLPIWLDNAEAITQLPEVSSQLIALYVSERDKQLRVEISES